MKLSDISIEATFGFFAAAALMLYFGETAADFFTASLIHEFGHLISMLLLTRGSIQIKLTAAGVYICPRYTTTVSCFTESVILISGPAAGVLAGAVIQKRCPEFSDISIMLSAVNMLPISGTDGGSLMRIVTGYRYNRIFRTIEVLSFIVILLFSLSPILSGEPVKILWMAAAAALWLRGRIER